MEDINSALNVSNLKEVLAILQLNSKQNWLAVTNVIVKIADNILKNPSEPKFRQLKKTNSNVRSNVIDIHGGIVSLLYMGFVENDLYFVLPHTAPLNKLRELTEKLSALRESVLNDSVTEIPYASEDDDESDEEKAEENSKELCSAEKKGPVVLLPNQPGDGCLACIRGVSHAHFPENVPKVTYPSVYQNYHHTYKNLFFKELERTFRMAQVYKNPELCARARSLIPVEKLERQAVQRLSQLQLEIKKSKSEDPDVSLQDFLVLELLHWFKNEFFTWVDSPACTFCGGKTQMSHMSEDPSMLIRTNRVEMHKCTQCSELTPFPRYNDPNCLLITRQGRCGEWANAFTLMCAAMGWMARIVYDQTDHVWTEVYLVASKRWVHCDSCENAFDTPLMYENGWGKKLSYCIGYSPEELQDVTWRYSSNHKEVLKRRNLCREDELIKAIVELRKLCQGSFTLSRQDYLTRITLQELIELMSEKKPSDKENQGRSSGSLAWRLARGETSTQSDYTWIISKEDASVGSSVTIRYSVALDRYSYMCLPNTSSKKSLVKWDSGIFESKNVFRKEESDWKMVYLARTEGSDEGSISWRFSIEDCDRVFDGVVIKFAHKLYEDGLVDIVVIGDEASVKFLPNSDSLITSALAGSKTIILKATLSKGKGDVAWQHTQLFRDSINSKDYQFSITFKFKSK